jgi:hypothetical protein
LPPPPRRSELDTISRWFLSPPNDFRSAAALETPLSEYGCQGLELDYVGLCWGGDLIWSNKAWIPRKMRGAKWTVIASEEARAFRLNSYRVLLTRARAGIIVYVPQGDSNDPTRKPGDFDAVVDALQAAGCDLLQEQTSTGR